jgi:hypothetical protein
VPIGSSLSPCRPVYDNQSENWSVKNEGREEVKMKEEEKKRERWIDLVTSSGIIMFY